MSVARLGPSSSCAQGGMLVVVFVVFPQTALEPFAAQPHQGLCEGSTQHADRNARTRNADALVVFAFIEVHVDTHTHPHSHTHTHTHTHTRTRTHNIHSRTHTRLASHPFTALYHRTYQRRSRAIAGAQPPTHFACRIRHL